MRLFLCLALLLWAAGPAAAQRPTELTLQQAVQSGVDRHPEVRARRLRVEAARAFAEGTGTQPNPTLQLSGHLGDAQEDANHIRQPFEIAGQPWLRGEIARLELRQAELGMVALQRRLALKVAQAYYRAWSAQRRMEVATERAVMAQKLEFVALRRYQVGEIPRNEYLRAQLEHARARAEFAVVSSEERGSRLQLALLLGLPPERELPLPAGAEAPAALAPPELPPLAGLLERARTRPELEAAAQYAEQAEREAELAGRERAPGLEFQAYRSTFDSEAVQGLMLSLAFPLWDYGEIGAEVARLEGEAAARRVDREAMTLDLELEVQEAWQRRLEFEGRRDALREQTRHYRELSEMAQRGYDAGLLTLVETLDTQRAYREAQLERIEAEADAQLSRLELHLVSGGEFPPKEAP